jgi:hypothetical protein
METKYLMCEFEDGIVYYRVEKIANPEDEFIYEGVELMKEEGDEDWQLDIYELTDEDMQEMYEDGFCDISQAEFDKVLAESGIDLDSVLDDNEE